MARKHHSCAFSRKKVSTTPPRNDASRAYQCNPSKISRPAQTLTPDQNHNARTCVVTKEVNVRSRRKTRHCTSCLQRSHQLEPVVVSVINCPMQGEFSMYVRTQNQVMYDRTVCQHVHLIGRAWHESDQKSDHITVPYETRIGRHTRLFGRARLDSGQNLPKCSFTRSTGTGTSMRVSYDAHPGRYVQYISLARNPYAPTRGTPHTGNMKDLFLQMTSVAGQKSFLYAKTSATYPQ